MTTNEEPTAPTDMPREAACAIQIGDRTRTRLATCHACPFWVGQCLHFEGCCFGRWVADERSRCPEDRWLS